MSFPALTFRDNGTTAAPITTTASYAVVPLLWVQGNPIPEPNNYFRSNLHGGSIGGTVRNTHASVTAKVKITGTSVVGSDGLPANTDPTTWPAEVAEATIAAASDANFYITVAHQLFYAVCVIDGSGHATLAIQAVSKPRA